MHFRWTPTSELVGYFRLSLSGQLKVLLREVGVSSRPNTLEGLKPERFAHHAVLATRYQRA